MNHQGGRAGQFDLNVSVQNEVNPHQSIGALGLLPSSSSLTAGSDHQMFTDRLSGPTTILPYQESANILPTRSAGVSSPHESISMGLNISSSSSLAGSVQRFPTRLSGPNFLHYQGNGSIAPSGAVALRHNMDSTAEHVGNTRYNNQNLSLSLCLHPYGPQNHSANSSSALNAINSGVPGYVVDEKSVDGSSSNTRHVQFKRRSPDRAFREFSIGESSSTGAQAGIPKRRVVPSLVNANNNGPANSHPGHYEAGIGHGTARTISDLQHLGEAAQTESNIHFQAAANPQAFAQPSILSAGYAGDSHVALPGQQPLLYQYEHPPFFSPAETSVGAISSVHPYEQVANFREVQQASPWIMRMRNAPTPYLPVYTVTGSEAMAPYHDQRNIPGSIMVGPQIGRGNWVHNPANFHFANGTANFVGNFPYPSSPHYGSFPALNLSNAPARVPRFNFHENYMQRPSGVVNRPVAPAIAFSRQNSHGPLDSDDSEDSRELDLSISIGNAPRTDNELRSVTRYGNQARGNPEPRFTLSALNSTEMRSRLAAEVRSALQHLRHGGTLRFEELMLLDYSLILHLLEVQNNQRGQLQINGENVPYGTFVVVDEQTEDEDSGLTEEDILANMRHEIFLSIAEETPENAESCCICQEDYVNGEELGRVDCGHRFHVSCIKQWLLLKNICPICKQMALTIVDEEEEA